MSNTLQPSTSTLLIYERALTQHSELLTLANSPDGVLEKKVASVSNWSIAQQVDHVATVIAAIVDTRVALALKNLPENSTRGLSLAGRIVLCTGRIPRGRPAPEMVLPKCKTLAEVRSKVVHAHERLQSLREKLGEIDRNPGRAPHPALGNFTAFQWLKFMPIHTEHHLKIIREIQAAG